MTTGSVPQEDNGNSPQASTTKGRAHGGTAWSCPVALPSPRGRPCPARETKVLVFTTMFPGEGRKTGPKNKGHNDIPHLEPRPRVTARDMEPRGETGPRGAS